MHHISMYCHKIDFSVIHTSLESFICRFMIVCVCVCVDPKRLCFLLNGNILCSKICEKSTFERWTYATTCEYIYNDWCLHFVLVSICCATIIMYNVLEVLFETQNWIFQEILWKCSIYLNFVSMSKVTNRSRETVLPLNHMQFGLYVLCE